MPIECTTQDSKSIFIYNNRIYSSQKYNGLDPDMSDIAVEFYQIIYKDKLKKLEYEILDKDGKLKVSKEYREFCGDTMNSYRTIEKKLSDDEKKRKLKDKYHSLANFWLLPMDVGHSSSWTKNRGLSKSKRGIDDYMDKFLQDYVKRHEEYSEKYREYANSFMLNKFGTDHFLEGIYVENNEVTEEMIFSDKEANDIANEMCKRIEKRAEIIAIKKEKELYDFFSKLKLI